MLSLDHSFMLFDDARQSSKDGRYYHDLRGEIYLENAGDVRRLADILRRALADGLYVAGYLSYEAGLVLEDRIAGLLPDDIALNQKLGQKLGQELGQELGWFGFFDGYDQIADVKSLLPPADNLANIPITPEISQAEYENMFAKIQHYIQSGDIYQANLTYRSMGVYAGDKLALYSSLRANAMAGYGGILNLRDGHSILSFSPELFFTLKNGNIIARPMKGTAPVHSDRDDDAAAIYALQHDPKQRAENLMIVDLLRNDLSKICEPYSVKVPQLFHIETYPTVHQMTSTVTGRLYHNHDAVDVLTHIFPCGSITGAPKIRSMEIIAEIEKSPRGAYCGSMGWIDPNGDAAFNVAIRSLSMQHDSDQFSIGLGSGVVADSNAHDEWAECLAKAAFISGKE